MKSVLTAIQPYYVFLIIARLMGWNIPQEKKTEVRKSYPQDSAWNKLTLIYCSKNKKSFNRIPAQYQPFMAKLLGKVIGEFVCDSIRKGGADNLIQAYYHNNPDETCLTDQELVLYATIGKPLYFWHISDLKIYDTPKDLNEFYTLCNAKGRCNGCEDFDPGDYYNPPECRAEGIKPIKCAPQSWGYVEAPITKTAEAPAPCETCSKNNNAEFNKRNCPYVCDK